MTKAFELGRVVFAAAVAGLGAQCIVRGNAVPALEPMLATAALPVIGWVTGAVPLLWVVLLHVPRLVAAPRNGGAWTGAFASVIPNWIPAHIFFAYAAGVAHVASGVSLLTGVLSRLAAYCTAAMFGSWVLIVHAPRVLLDSHNPSEWTSMFIALGMCGGALLIASVLANISRAASPVAMNIRFEARAPIATWPPHDDRRHHSRGFR